MTSKGFGVVGLGVMGRNLALNLARHGFPVMGFDLDAEQRRIAHELLANEGSSTVESLARLVLGLEPPRRVMLMVPAGPPVDRVVDELTGLLAPGDIVIDGGNSHFHDTQRRQGTLQQHGLNLLGTGVSGGEAGALAGPAIMPGGPRDAYRLVEEALTAIAARSDEGPCCAYMGSRGAGHFVKMVHNGIEYAIMQLIGEVYSLLGIAGGLSAPEQAEVFATWKEGELGSYLVEITAAVLAKVDDVTGLPLVDVILDTAGQKGTGKWTSQTASDLGVAVPSIDAALHGRMLSALKSERVAAAGLLGRGGDRSRATQPSPGSLVELTRDALRVASVAAYAQGFALLREGSREYGFGLDLAEIARVWKGGCIIRARVLNEVRAALLADPDLTNLLVAPVLVPVVRALDGALREVVVACVRAGVACPGFSATLAYLDSVRTERLPANLLQAQRDFFGAHTYRRIDKPADVAFHTIW
ncbi:MAG TPA: NADP-dependent phosphogluconate dehydrogenase [Thermoanaerobaculaceae bacterium]|nr:NADP-dependent phosphogluconate dehydrogenase [Thermoanaerobaculaceae bacterium]HPS76628.1 NADP-dependent phosphogluconate dehydrogenase [Thermoanaerobaculaceae bacterium]